MWSYGIIKKDFDLLTLCQYLIQTLHSDLQTVTGMGYWLIRHTQIKEWDERKALWDRMYRALVTINKSNI